LLRDHSRLPATYDPMRATIAQDRPQTASREFHVGYDSALESRG
jgi:hypothetical protein